MTYKILITGQIDPSSLLLFQKNKNFEVSYNPDCKQETLFNLIPNCHVLITRSETKIDKELLDKAINLKIAARAAVGVGNIDISYATQKGVLVFNTPGLNTNSAAEQTWCLLLGMMRKLVEAQNHMKSGGWERHKFCGYELRGKSLGIVGLGNVGHRVAKFARGFDMEVYAYDPYISPEVFTRHKVRNADSLCELASQVDILSVHVPLTKQTRKMIDSKVLLKMKKGSYLLNVARGDIVCEKSVLGALNGGILAGSAIDTWADEPKPDQEFVSHSKVYATPHIGASTYEAQKKIGFSVYEQVVKALEGKMVEHPINLPRYSGVESNLIACYTQLSEKIGSLYSQILKKNPKEFKLKLFGALGESDLELICLGFMKGYISNISEKYISYVNAKELFLRLGIKIECSCEPRDGGYPSSIKTYALLENDSLRKIHGIVFEKRYTRVTQIDNFSFEMEPSGKLVLIENDDKPGVIGDVGLTLATHNINIESFVLSREKEGGKALALIRVDSSPEKNVLEELRSLKNIRFIRFAQL